MTAVPKKNEFGGEFIESEDEDDLNRELNDKALIEKGHDPKTFGKQDSVIYDISSRVEDVKAEGNPPQHQSMPHSSIQNVAPAQNSPFSMSLPKASNINQAPGMQSQNPYGYDMGYGHQNTAPAPNNYQQYPNQNPGQNPYGGYPQK